MRILINGLSARQGGGQTYLLNLLRFYPSNLSLKIYLAAPDSLKVSETPANLHRLSIPKWALNPFLRVVWEKWVLPRHLKALQVDVLFCPGGMVSTPAPEGCKTAVTFQNMLPFAPEERRRYPWGYMRFRLWLLRFLQGHSFQQTDLVIFISQYAKQVIDQALPYRKGKSVVVPHGLSDHFRRDPNRSFPNEMPSEYVLYVSILDVYKAQLEVVRAWHRLREQRDTPEKLVLVGPSYPPYKQKVRLLIQQLGLEQEVILRGSVPYAELPTYYQHAKVNLFASSCENCPNILLEALAAGQPLLSSNYPPMPEFGEDAVAYFNPYDPNELADLLARYLGDAELRTQRGKQALGVSLKYQWADVARKTWEVLENLGGTGKIGNY